MKNHKKFFYKIYKIKNILCFLFESSGNFKFGVNCIFLISLKFFENSCMMFFMIFKLFLISLLVWSLKFLALCLFLFFICIFNLLVSKVWKFLSLVSCIFFIFLKIFKNKFLVFILTFKVFLVFILTFKVFLHASIVLIQNFHALSIFSVFLSHHKKFKNKKNISPFFTHKFSKIWVDFFKTF